GEPGRNPGRQEWQQIGLVPGTAEREHLKDGGRESHSERRYHQERHEGWCLGSACQQGGETSQEDQHEQECEWTVTDRVCEGPRKRPPPKSERGLAPVVIEGLEIVHAFAGPERDNPANVSKV